MTQDTRDQLTEHRERKSPECSGRARPLVSVIVPVYRDAARLRLCLAAIGRQSLPAPLREVIVVDNATEPDRDVAASAEEVGARYLHEAVPGSYAARNLGAMRARGEILAFTDADCVPHERWLECGVQACVEADLVAGRVDLFFPNPGRVGAVELFESLVAFEQEKYAAVGYAATANAFVRAGTARGAGLFRPELRSHGDREFGMRIVARGNRVVYCKEALVYHPARSSLAELLRRSRRLAGGVFGVLRIQEKSLVRSIGADLLPPVQFAVRVWRAGAVAGVWNKVKVVVVMVLTRWVSALEKTRLALGGEPIRE